MCIIKVKLAAVYSKYAFRFVLARKKRRGLFSSLIDVYEGTFSCLETEVDDYLRTLSVRRSWPTQLLEDPCWEVPISSLTSSGIVVYISIIWSRIGIFLCSLDVMNMIYKLMWDVIICMMICDIITVMSWYIWWYVIMYEEILWNMMIYMVICDNVWRDIVKCDDIWWFGVIYMMFYI